MVSHNSRAFGFLRDMLGYDVSRVSRVGVSRVPDSRETSRIPRLAPNKAIETGVRICFMNERSMNTDR